MKQGASARQMCLPYVKALIIRLQLVMLPPGTIMLHMRPPITMRKSAVCTNALLRMYVKCHVQVLEVLERRASRR